MSLNINNSNLPITNRPIKVAKTNYSQDLTNNTETLTEIKNSNTNNTSSNNKILSINDIPYTLPINQKEKKLIEINQNKFQKRILKEFILYCNQNHLDKNDNSILFEFLENKNKQIKKFLQEQFEKIPEKSKKLYSLNELTNKINDINTKMESNNHIIDLNNELSTILDDENYYVSDRFLKDLQTIFPDELPKDLHYNNANFSKKLFRESPYEKLISDEQESEDLRTKNYLKQIQSKLNELASKATLENNNHQNEILTIISDLEKNPLDYNNLTTKDLTVLNKLDQYRNIIDPDNIINLYMNIIKESNVDTYINTLRSKNKEIKMELKQDQKSLNLKLDQLKKELDTTKDPKQRSKILNDIYGLRTFINSSNALILDYQTQYQQLQEKRIKDYSSEPVTETPILDVDNKLSDLISSKTLTRKKLSEIRADRFNEQNDNSRVFPEYSFDDVTDQNGKIDTSKTLLKSKLNPEGTIINISKDLMSSLFKQKEDGTIDLSFKQNLYGDCYLLSSIDYIFNDPELFLNFLNNLEEENNEDGSKNLIIKFSLSPQKDPALCLDSLNDSKNLFSGKNIDLKIGSLNSNQDVAKDPNNVFKVKIPFKKNMNQYKPVFKLIEEENKAKSESVIFNVIEEAYTIKRLDECLSDFDNAENFIKAQKKSVKLDNFALPYPDINMLRKELQDLQSGSVEFKSIISKIFSNINYLGDYIDNYYINNPSSNLFKTRKIATVIHIYQNYNSKNNLALQNITNSETSNIISNGNPFTVVEHFIPNLNEIRPDYYKNFESLNSFREEKDTPKILKENFLYSICNAITHNFRTNDSAQMLIPSHQYNIAREINDSVFLVNPHNNKTVFETTKKVLDLF